MPRQPKPKPDRQAVVVNYRFRPYVRIEADNPSLSGLYGVGATYREALENFRSVVARAYPFSRYDVTEQFDGKSVQPEEYR